MGEARTSRITTIEDDAAFIENLIKASERREVKTFSVSEPKLKEQENKLIPYDRLEEANILESGKIKVGDPVASTDPSADSYNWRGEVVKMHPTNPDLCFVRYRERIHLNLRDPIITAFLSELRLVD